MSKYSIAYIDEEEEHRDAFQYYFDIYPEFEVHCILPSGKTIDDVVNEVVELNPDVVVVDYYLKYADPEVSDNGDAFIQRINDRKPLLPTMLFTSYVDKAKHSFLPPEKKLTTFKKEKISNRDDDEFKNTVYEYISYYKELLKKYKTEFSELSLKETLTEKERGRLKELDIILESAPDRQTALPEKSKADETIEKLDDLILSTRELLDEIKRNRNDN
jgi:hypothetical protein